MHFFYIFLLPLCTQISLARLSVLTSLPPNGSSSGLFWPEKCLFYSFSFSSCIHVYQILLCPAFLNTSFCRSTLAKLARNLSGVRISSPWLTKASSRLGKSLHMMINWHFQKVHLYPLFSPATRHTLSFIKLVT